MISSSEMIKRAGCTYRQLDYWIRGGIVAPLVDAKGSGSRRCFTTEQVWIVRAITDLARLGAEGRVLSRAARALEDWPSEEWHGYVFVDETGGIYRQGTGSAWALDLDRCVDSSEAPELALA